ncbi:MAG: GNAT family acetyltransferase [bacterium]|nr:GNAT family acetyltransferase [bacterium]
MQIRPFVESDRQAVVGLWGEVFSDPPPWNDPDTDIGRKLQVQPELLLVATVGSDLVGTALAGYDGHRGWVYYVAVSPDHRRRGIGSALMRRVEQLLADRGCPKLNLQVRAGNDEVVAFYESLGYQVEPRISLGKRLTGT